MCLHQTRVEIQIGDWPESGKLDIFELVYGSCEATGDSKFTKGIFSAVYWHGDASVQDLHWSDMNGGQGREVRVKVTIQMALRTRQVWRKAERP